MASSEKWCFTKEKLENSPSRKCGYDCDKELSYRQQAANFIQDMGQRLLVSQLCINTAIVYMHRFYVFHSFTVFHRNAIAVAALFLAAKVEEQPRRLEHIIKVAHLCLNHSRLDIRSPMYIQQAEELVLNENLLLETLGFEVAIDHPHTHVVRCCHLVRANKDLARASYFLASNTLHLTTMCLQYKPTVVACFCIHLACKWSNWEIPQSSEGKDWYWYIDRNVTLNQLEQLTAEFLTIFDKCPTKLKNKIRNISSTQNSLIKPPLAESPVYHKRRRMQSPELDSTFSGIQESSDSGVNSSYSTQNSFDSGEPQHASTSRDCRYLNPCASSSQSSYQAVSNSRAPPALQQSTSGVKTNTLEFVRSFLELEASHPRNSTKRLRFENNEKKSDGNVSKQYVKTENDKNHFYGSYR